MTTIGHATLDVIPSVKGLRSELSKQTGPDLDRAGVDGGTRFGQAAGSSAGSRFGSLFRKAAQASIVGAAALAAGGVKLAFDSISAASDLEESTNKVTQVFGKAAESVLKFTETTADALGQTNNEARSAAATFGIFGNTAGLADRKNARFAKRMTTLASDLASFNNTDPSQAVEALGAALRGESEPIRAYGVLLDEATLKAEALRLGILKPVKDQSKIFAYQTRVTDLQKSYNEAVAESGKGSLDALKAQASLGTAQAALSKATEGTLPPLTQQQKLLAAQSQIFKQTEVAQGDFARTSDGLANQQRRLSARFEDAKAKLGAGLLPIMTQAADFLLDKGIPAFEDFSAWFNKDGIPAIKKFGDKAEDVAGQVKDLVGFLKDLPSPAKYAGLAALLGGGAALKLRGGSGGALGTAGKVLGISKPVPVFVTNPGGLGGLGDGAGGGRKKAPSKGFLASLGFAGFAGLGTLWANEFLAETAGPKVAVSMAGPQSQGGGGGLGAPPGFFDFSDSSKDDGAKSEKRTQALRDFYLAGEDAARTAEKLGVITDANVGKFDAFYRSTDRAKGGLKEIKRSGDILTATPIRPRVDTTEIERALALLNTLKGLAGRDDFGDRGFTGGDSAVTPLPPGNSRAGVNFNGPINVTAHDYNDFTRQLERKTQQAGLGGRP